LTVYRLTRKAHADLTGSGGLHAAGRCNRKGTPVIYAAQHVSLALVEALVHMELADVPGDYVLMTIDIPDTVPARRATPEEALAASGQPLVPVFIVPSVIVPQEFNIVIYPQAVGFSARITNVEPFRVDERLPGLGKDR
jgi:RES domain-containing protein